MSSSTPSPLPFTFGIELEFILALHHTKSTSHPSRNDFNRPSPTKTTWDTPFRTIDPLKFLEEKFSNANLDSVTSNNPKTSDIDYRTWLITTDGSLPSSIPDDELARYLPDRFKSADGKLKEGGGKGEWTTHGIELVSPPLGVPGVGCKGRVAVPATCDCGIDEITSYLTVLHTRTRNSSPSPKHSSGSYPNTSTSAANVPFTTPHCGLHIHLGLPNSQPIPLPILQHLALLLLQYEDVISSLHHHSRAPLPGTQGGVYARSNRVSFLTSTHCATCTLSKAGSGGKRSRGGFDIGLAKQRIFAKDMSVERLAWLMGSESMLNDEGEVVVDYRDISAGCSDHSSLADKEQSHVGSQDVEEFDKTAVNRSVTPASIKSSPSSESQSEVFSAALSLSGPSTAPSTPPCESESWPTGESYQPPTDLVSPPISQRFFPTGEKYKLSRWNLLPRHVSEGPRTIEFRQPAGSLDAEEVRETVGLYVSLVREAERRANADEKRDGEAEMGKGDADLGGSEAEDEVALDGFLVVLRLSSSAKKYWKARATRLAEERFFALRDDESLKPWDRCHACAVSHNLRNRSRQMRAQSSRGWRRCVNGFPKGKRAAKKGLKNGSSSSWETVSAATSVKETKIWEEGKPVKSFRGKSKGKKACFTRKAKTNAIARAKVKARKQSKKAPAWGFSAWEAAQGPATNVWSEDWHAPGPKIKQRWETLGAGAQDEPVGGW